MALTRWGSSGSNKIENALALLSLLNHTNITSTMLSGNASLY